MVNDGGEEVVGKHQGSRAHPGESSARPEAARIGLATRVAAAVGGCMAVVELSTACEAGDGWYGFGGTTTRWCWCWLGVRALEEARTAVAMLCQPSIADTRSGAARANTGGPERENERVK